MRYDPQKHHRRSMRLKGYDYSQAGAYFITICTHDRKCLFGEIVNGAICLNEIGNMVAEEWLRSAQIRKEIELDEWVVMPNHIHGIVVFTSGPVGAHGGEHGRETKDLWAHGGGHSGEMKGVGAHGGEHGGEMKGVGAHGRAPHTHQAKE